MAIYGAFGRPKENKKDKRKGNDLTKGIRLKLAWLMLNHYAYVKLIRGGQRGTRVDLECG